MRNLLLFLLIPALYFSSLAQSYSTGYRPEEPALKDSVKQVAVNSYALSLNKKGKVKTKENQGMDFVIGYNINGDITYHKNVYSWATEETFFEYDSMGNCTRKKIISSKEGLKSDDRYIYRYNERGDKIYEEHYKNDSLYSNSRFDLNYDSSGNLLSYQNFDLLSAKYVEGALYTYDRMNRMTEEKYLSDGIVSTARKNVYTTSGKMAGWEYYNAQTEYPSEKMIFRYDHNDQLIQETHVYFQLQESKEIRTDSSHIFYERDSKGNILSLKSSPSETEFRNIYNNRGERIQSLVTQEGSSTKRLYEYDHRGNCLRMTVYLSKQSSVVTERHIEYY